MKLQVVEGDLLEQDVEVIVNAWNRNIIPWWLLVPQGVSGAIRKRAGYAPFRELGRVGPIPVGGAALTSAGRLPFKAIIHVAGINMLWIATEYSIRTSVRNAIELVSDKGYRSVALPLIGAGIGGGGEAKAMQLIKSELAQTDYDGDVVIVSYQEPTA
mgnify:CR=1 FL=1|jgi:O-acetyl-ADP-ribose deacetylase (regulator of RNase III)|tara:strand:- start:6782 stop:7255 length:474 start_codon:yes stop_codon:yes gene_type:complete